jgi:hypothetical protein
MVANEGYKLLPLYRFCPMTGQWVHKDKFSFKTMSLKELRYQGGRMSYPSRKMTAPEWVLPDYLKEAQQRFDSIPDHTAGSIQKLETQGITEAFEKLRWFILPLEHRK